MPNKWVIVLQGTIILASAGIGIAASLLLPSRRGRHISLFVSCFLVYAALVSFSTIFQVRQLPSRLDRLLPTEFVYKTLRSLRAIQDNRVCALNDNELEAMLRVLVEDKKEKREDALVHQISDILEKCESNFLGGFACFDSPDAEANTLPEWIRWFEYRSQKGSEGPALRHMRKAIQSKLLFETGNIQKFKKFCERANKARGPTSFAISFVSQANQVWGQGAVRRLFNGLVIEATKSLDAELCEAYERALRSRR